MIVIENAVFNPAHIVAIEIDECKIKLTAVNSEADYSWDYDTPAEARKDFMRIVEQWKTELQESK